jgi:hypothetical protein
VTTHAARALRIAVELGDVEKLVVAHGCVCSACYSIEDNDEALDHAREAAKYCEEASDLGIKPLGGFYLGTAHSFSGRYCDGAEVQPTS